MKHKYYRYVGDVPAPLHVLKSSLHSSQALLSRSALLLMFLIPKPPTFLGAPILLELSRHLLSFAFSSAVHKKCLQSLSFLFIAHLFAHPSKHPPTHYDIRTVPPPASRRTDRGLEEMWGPCYTLFARYY